MLELACSQLELAHIPDLACPGKVGWIRHLGNFPGVLIPTPLSLLHAIANLVLSTLGFATINTQGISGII